MDFMASDAGESGAYSTTRRLAAIPTPIIGEYVWENPGPECVFMIPVLIDMPVRRPILSTVTETFDSSQSA